MIDQRVVVERARPRVDTRGQTAGPRCGGRSSPPRSLRGTEAGKDIETGDRSILHSPPTLHQSLYGQGAGALLVAVAAADEPGVVAHPLAFALSWPVFGDRQVAQCVEDGRNQAGIFGDANALENLIFFAHVTER